MQMTDERPQNQDAELTWNDFTPHPVGIFRAEFTGFEKPEPHPQYGQRILLHFTTEEKKENGENFTISVFTSISLGPKARVRPMLAAMGVDVTQLNVKTFKLSEYIGRKLVLVIEHEPRADGMGINAVIKSFQPLRSTKPKPSFEEDDTPPPSSEE
jgi:hypothetical protein